MPEGFAFCGRCGAPLPSARDLEERRVVTVLFCDLVGFTARSDRADPEDVRALLRPYHARLRHEIERFGGTLDKFIGDGVMAVFGAPVAHEDDPERAVRCGLAIQQAVADLNQTQADLALSARVGVTTGEAVIAWDRHETESVVGDVVNTASRLEGVAPVGGVAVGEPTFRATRGVLDYQPLAPVRVKGKAEPLAVWRAISARRRLGAVSDQRPATPLVGRTSELEQLEAAFTRTREEASVQLVTVVGEPGVGKSRLVREFHGFVDHQPELITWRQGHCLPYGEGISFWALGEALKAHAGIQEFDPPSVAAAKLADNIAAVTDEVAERQWLGARLAPLLGLAGAVGATGGQPEREEAFTAWRRFLEAVAAKRPLVVVLEDLHWADEAMLAFIRHLVENASGVPMLVVATARLELYDHAPDWGSLGGRTTTVSLKSLSDTDTARLLASLLGLVVLPAELQATLLEQVGGNPLYAEQVCRMLEEQGLLKGDVRMPLAGPGVRPGVFPPSIQALIAARLDTLPPERRALLQSAAVVGTVFWPGALSAISGRDLAMIRADLEDLAARAFIRTAGDSSVAGETEYAFWHALTREVAYGQLPRTARIHRHRAVAEWIEQVAGERVTDHAELLTHHYVTALELARAARATGKIAELQGPALRSLILAGDRAMSLDLTRADSHYQRAISLCPPDDPERPPLLIKGAQVAVQKGRFTEAERQYQQAIASFQTQGNAVGAGDAMAGLSMVHWQRGESVRARQTLTTAIQLLRHESPGVELASAYSSRAFFSLLSGELDQALEGAGETIALADRLGAATLRQSALQVRGTARFDLGLDGVADVREALELGMRLGLGRETAVAYGNLTDLLLEQDGPMAALETSRRSVQLCQERGITDLALASQGDIAECLVDLGDWDQALGLLEELITSFQRLGGYYFGIFSEAAKAHILLYRGELSSAAVLLERFLPRARAIGDPQVLAKTFPVAARIRQAHGDLDTAARLVGEFAQATRGAPARYRMNPLPELIRVYIAAQQLPTAERLLEVAEASAVRARHSLVTARGLLTEARGDVREAAAIYRDAAERWRSFGVAVEHGLAQLGAGRCLTKLGRPRAREPLLKAEAIFASLGAQPLIADTNAWLQRAPP